MDRVTALQPVRPLRLVPLLALLATLLVAPAATPARAADGFDVQIRPTTAGNTAVRSQQTVSVSGTVPTGELRGASFVAQEEDGDETAVPVEFTSEDQGGDFLRVEDGTVTGRLTLLGCLFGPGADCAPRDPARRVLLALTVGGAEGRSNPLRVDFERPQLRGASLITTTRVLVRFTEPVRQRQGELPGDFVVTDPDRLVTAVEGPRPGDCVGAYLPGEDASAGDTGCTRTLVLAAPVDEDDDPDVRYFLQDNRVPERTPYDDFASNRLFGLRTVEGLDAVRPPAPRIDSVDGRPVPAAGRVFSRSGQAQLDVSGLRQGHDVFVLVGPEQREAAAVRAAGETARLTVPGLEEGETLLRVVARDPAGNRSTDQGKQAARADGTPSAVTYVVDTVAPGLRAAVRLGSTQVRLVFSEPVARRDGAADQPGDFGVTAADGSSRRVTRVSGEGASRTLDVEDAGAAVRVAYSPLSEPGRYADRAGNTVPDTTVDLLAVGAPQLTSPLGLTYTRASVFPVTGTAEAGRVVELFRDAGDDGTPDALVDSETLGEGQTAFSLDLPLPADGPHDALVRARGASEGDPVSATVDVPRVVRDTVPPSLTLASPRGGEVLPGGRDREIVFDVEDANRIPGAVRIEFSSDGGTTYELVVSGTDDESYTWRTPALDTERGRLRLTATDRAGGTTVIESGLFAIDALPPLFSAVTRHARTVVVTFSEAVSGRSTAVDWRIEDEPASSAEESSTPDGRRVVTLTTGPRTTVGRDERPEVEYAPSAVSSPYRDRAGQEVPPLRRVVEALDGILPADPTVTGPTQAVLTRETSRQVTGTADPGDRVELLDAQDRRVAGPVTVAADRTWSVQVPLVRDTVSALRARALDANDNRSATSVPVPAIEQDASDPVVRVTEPVPGTRLAPGSRVAVRWTSTDRNLVERATTVQVSTDGGRTFTVLGQEQPASGALAWDVPTTTTSNALVLVTTPDRAGRTGTGTSSPLGIGEDAQPTASGSPSASPSAAGASPSAASPGSGVPSAPPLGIAVSPSRITPGQLSTITVSGTPGTRVELQAYSRPRTEYTQVRTGALGPDGRVAFQIRPGTNTRLFARVLGGGSDSRSAVVNVSTALSLTVVRNGRRDYTFQGRILPRRSGQLITLYRVTADGREIITNQLRTDSTGTYRIRRVFTGSGRFGFLTRTGHTLTNASGVSNGGRARPTEVF